MTIKLSDVELLPGIMWTDRWGSQEVSQKILRTIGGNAVFFHAAIHNASAITLESLGDQGWQTLETVEKLYALAAVPGAQYLLDLGTVQFSVMFRHEEAPAFEATPLIPKTLADAGQYFLVKLKLITV
jgi:hypothetical protein